MAQVIPNLGSLSGALEGLGAGLGAGLQDLASRKIAQLQASQRQTQLSGLLQRQGYTPEQSELISALPEKDLLTALQSLSPSQPQVASQQLAQVQPESQQASLQEALGQLKAETPQVSGLELLKQAQTQKLGEIGLGQKQAQQPGFTPINAQELFEQARLQGITLSPEQQQKINQKVAAINASEDLQKKLQDFIGKQASQQQAFQPTQAAPKPLEPLFKKPLTEMEKLKKESIEEKKRAEAYKLTKEERKEIASKAKAARQNLRDLDRLEELEREGKLDTPGYIEMLKRSGFDIPALLNPGSEEYQKVAQTFIRDAKTYLGSRISNFELEQFLKTIPSLSQSPEGRKRVIANLKYINNVSLAYNDALKDVIASNNGIPPLDLEEKIDDKIEKKLDSIADKFKKDISKEVPPSQNKLVTALQAALGGAAAAIPGALKGAAKGAIVGSVVPGLGTGAGAALGALGGGSGLI